MSDEMVLPKTPTEGVPLADVDEFAGIEPRRRMRSPVVAAVAALLAVYLAWHLRSDFLYFWAGRTPSNLGDGRRAVASLPDLNSYVVLRGAPDRTNAALLDVPGKDQPRQLFRLLGTGSRLFVLRTFGSIPAERTLDDEFSGRLIAFRDLSFSDSARDWMRNRVSATHLFDPARLLPALAAGTSAVTDLAGDAVKLTPEMELAIDLAYPDQYQLTVPPDRFADAPSVGQALARAGVTEPHPIPPPVVLTAAPGEFYLLIASPREDRRVDALRTLSRLEPKVLMAPDPADPAQIHLALPRRLYPDGEAQVRRALDVMGFASVRSPPWYFAGTIPPSRRDAVLARLAELDPAIAVVPRTETVMRRVAALAGGARFGAGRPTRIKLMSPLAVPEDARVVVESDAPSSYWYIPVLYLLLAAFFVFNLYALREALPWRSASSTR